MSVSASDFYRNDVSATGITGVFLPCLYTLMIIAPFVQVFARPLFHSRTQTSTQGVVCAHVYKDSYNPFFDDVYQVSVVEHDNPRNFFAASDSYELVEYFESLPKSEKYFIVTNGDITQEIALRRLLSDILDEAIFEKLKFVDIHVLFMYRMRMSEKQSVSDMMSVLGLTKDRSNVQNYYALLDALDVVDTISEVLQETYQGVH